MLKQFFFSACAIAATAAISSGQTRSASANPAPPSMVSINEVAPITADIVLSATDDSGTEQPDRLGHYYRSHDGRVCEDLGFGSVITDKRAGRIITLNSSTKQAIIAAAPGPKGRDMQKAPNAGSDTPTVADLGQSTVEGHPVVRKQITTSSSNGISTEVWTASDIRLVVFLKSTAASGRTTIRQYRNIQTVEPDPNVFAIPQDYTVIDKTANSAAASAPAH